MRIRVAAPVIIDRKYYPVGVQEVPETISKHWFFQALVKDKKIEVIPSEKVAATVKPPPKVPPVKTAVTKPPTQNKMPVAAKPPAPKVEAPKTEAPPKDA